MKIKKLMASTLAATMIGATALTGAVMAEEVVIAPNQAGLDSFVQIGTAGALASPLIVIGSNAASAIEYPKDVAAAGDMAAALAGYATTSVTLPTVTTSEIINGVTIATSSTKLYLNDQINKARNVLTKKDMPEILNANSFTDAIGKSHSYSQYIELGDNMIQFAKPGNEGDPEIHIDASTPLYTTRVVFTKAVDFSSEDVKGESLTLFGVEHMIGFESDNTEIVLFGAGTNKVITVGDTITASIGGKDHTIEVSSVADSETAVIVVDDKLKEITEGNGYTFSGNDGPISVFVKGIYFAGSGGTGINQVELIIGAEKLTLRDGQQVKRGDDSIDGTQVSIVGNGSVSKIDISVQGNDDNEEILTEESFSDPVFNTFKIAFLDSEPKETDTITIDSNGNTATISFTDYLDHTKTLEFAYKDGVDLRMGDQNGRLTQENGYNVTERDYVVIGPKDFSEFTHLFKVTNINQNENEFTLQDVMSGESEDYPNGTFYVDGQQYEAEINGTVVRFSGLNETAAIKAINNEYIRFDSDAMQVVVKHEDGIENIINITNTTDEVKVIPASLDGFVSLESDTDVRGFMTSYGVLVTYNSNDEGRIVLNYPNEQTVMTVAIGEDPTFSTSETEGGTYETVYHITQPIVRLDNEEIPNTADLVLIGGPCANALVRTLITEGCDSWNYTTGIIRTVDNAFGTGQKALIIAGTTADDTRALAAMAMSGTLSYEA